MSGDTMKMGGNGNGENGPKPLMGGRRRSAKQSSWMAHVKATMRANPRMNLRQALKEAGRTYKKKKSMRGGEFVGANITPGVVGGMEGGRRRRSRTRRARRGGNDQ
jgi:hypothetical protein